MRGNDEEEGGGGDFTLCHMKGNRVFRHTRACCLTFHTASAQNTEVHGGSPIRIKNVFKPRAQMRWR